MNQSFIQELHTIRYLAIPATRCTVVVSWGLCSTDYCHKRNEDSNSIMTKRNCEMLSLSKKIKILNYVKDEYI